MIIYNTFIDNSGAIEFGQNKGTQYGPNDDTFAYNKFINNSCIAYVNVTGTFACTAARLHFWNNVIIENGNSRHTGINFGQDVLGDGQSFTNWKYWNAYPLNPSISNPTGWRPFQYGSDTGVAADTLFDIRNNVIWNNNGLIMKYTGRTKIKYRNNIYKLGGGSTLGATLDTGEILATNKVFVDTTSTNPANWDFNLQSGSPAINTGVAVGISQDWNGSTVTNPPSIGIYNYISNITPCIFTYEQWSICTTSGWQNRDYITSPIGCTGMPPLDSIQRACNSGIIISSFYYSSSNKRIYIKCNVAGVMTITNTSGSITRTSNYNANGYFISVNTLPTGTYFATTYGRSLTFTR